MNKIKKCIAIIIVFILVSACSKDTSEQPIANVGYAAQYQIDVAKIEAYLKSHSVTVTNNPGFTDDQNATFTSVPNLDLSSIWGSDAANPKESLLFKNATFAGVEHKIYYLKFRQGVGVNPTINNQIKTYYKGFLLNGNVFDQSAATGATFPLNQLILGWQEIFPEFKEGISSAGNQNVDFGSGVMFVPSAFAYYNQSLGNGAIPAYSPLVFSFKLYEVL